MANKSGYLLPENSKYNTKRFKSALSVLDAKSDLISESEYIDELTKLRNKFLSEGTKEWEVYTAKIREMRTKSELDTLDAKRKMGIVSEKEYYEELKSIRDNYLAKGSSEWIDYSEKIALYNIENIKSAYDEIASYAGEKLGEIEENQKGLYKRLEGETELMHYVKIHGANKNGGTLLVSELRNLEYQNEFLEKYSDYIQKAADRIKNSGMSEDAAARLFERMIEMSPEDGKEFAYLLNRATDDEFKKYVSDFEENYRLLDEVSKNPFREEWKSTTEEILALSEEAGFAISSALKEAGFSVPDEFFSVGEDSADSFIDGFLTEIGIEIDSVKARLTEQVNKFSPVVYDGVLGGSSVYSPTFNLYGSGETDIERIKNAKQYAELDKMAGGY